MRRVTVFGVALLISSATMMYGQQATPSGVTVVQPGAPGHGDTILKSAAKVLAPRPPSPADVAFMQGMIVHHNQAVVMTAWLLARSHDPEVRELGKRISVSQTDEMRWMKQWLTDRGLPITASSPMGGMKMAGMHHDGNTALMPGMLTPNQMETLRNAREPEFDHLFLTGMIQHHTGALNMVKDLFATQGAGQDPFLFDFASDVTNTQQAEIDIMRNLLKENK